jgi:hypothetical protein
MKRSDFRCEECNTIFEICVEDIKYDFPKNPECTKCKSIKTHRKFTNILIDVAEGRYGNSKTGYTKGIVYHPSRFGQFHGKKV